MIPDIHDKFHSANGKRTVLVVEDERINREILSMVLSENYNILSAETGKEALDTINNRFDTISLVLLDLNLPDMSGIEILKNIKQNTHLTRIPVIVMTSDRESEVESLTIGASDFIPKPYPEPRVILARINRTIELSEDRDIIRWTERDQLTGLYNPEYFYRYAEQYDMYHKADPMDAIVMDINHFHIINERYGKPFGDGLLKQIAEALLNNIAPTGGMACRREGDTFLIYCPHREDYTDLLEEAVKDLGSQNQAHVRMRMGIYSEADKSIDIERRFDRAKLAADTLRGNFTSSVAIYDSALHDKEVFSEQLLDGFADAVSQKQFEVYYQPKFDIRPGQPILGGAEALIRWKHPDLGMISPGVFIPLFESNGLIPDLDTYVWEEAAKQITLWKKQYRYVMPVSVNVSRVDMLDPGLVDKLVNIVRQNGLSFADLHLEITESAYTQDAQQIISTVKHMRDTGFVIEMDDFGSGYSSLNMISTLPIDALKLDMQFIRSAFSERKDTRMLGVVFDIAESLGVPTIAEGVETAEQMYTLKAMGCDMVQGYYFSRPLPASEFEKFLKERNAIAEDGISAAETASARRMHKTRGAFAYEALHDPVTGMYNNSGFEMLYNDADKNHIALIIMRVNGLPALPGREKNDSIRRVSEALRHYFRSVDLIFRLQENEFAVIMTRVTGELKQLISEKIADINREIAPLAIYAGAALNDRENPSESMLDDADQALKSVTGQQYGNVTFY